MVFQTEDAASGKIPFNCGMKISTNFLAVEILSVEIPKELYSLFF
jgi:hypothetical protein